MRCLHIDQSVAMHLCGNLLRKLNRPQEAIDYLKKAEKVIMTLTDNSQLDDHSQLLFSFVKTYMRLGKLIEALEYFKEHKNRFGEQHPRTIKIKKYIEARV